LLRGWREGDAAAFEALSADGEVMRYLPAADPNWVRRIRAHWSEHGFGQWVVEIPEEEVFIGVVGPNHVRFALPFAPAIEAAWRLARRCWGKGYATEAARAAIDDGFSRLGFAEIVAFTVPANHASQRVMMRLGMGRDPAEDFDHPRFPEGHPLRRHVLYRLRRAAS
jgi:RimJ/RimL family protein N-acetyltransferase